MNFNKHEPLARRSQSQTIEFKQIWKDDYLKTICAFANSDGGSLYLGVKDNGAICGTENYKKILETLPNKINNRLGLLCDVLSIKKDNTVIHRREKLEYPYTALKEAVINALIHRDYSNTSNLQIKVFDNKLVMYNGALLSPEVPIENFSKPHQSKPFNPIIASVFYKAGLIENWGKGTINIIDDCVNYNIPKPTFEYAFSAVRTTFYNNSDFSNGTLNGTLNERQKTILGLMKNKPNVTIQELINLSKIPRRTIMREIKKLKELNIIKRIGSDKTGYWEVENN